MKTKEIKEMTKEERKAFILMKFKTYQVLMTYDYLEMSYVKVTENVWLEDAKQALRLLKNMYYMENGEKLNVYEVLRL